MHQAADILDSPANMQVQQLWVLQTMAKSVNSKVVFVPMQLQSDVVAQLGAGSGSGAAGPSGSGAWAGSSTAGNESDAGAGATRAGLLTSMADI